MNERVGAASLRALVRERAGETNVLAREIAGEARSQLAAGWRSLIARRLDLVVGSLIGAAFVALSLYLFGLFDPLKLLPAFDIWFEADVPRVVEALQVRDSEYHLRTSVHPLIALMFSTPMLVVRGLGIGVPEMAAAHVALGAFALGLVTYLALRAVRLQRIDAVLLAAALPSTAGGIYWMAVPETYAWGAVSLLVPLIWATRARGSHDRWSGPLQSAFSLSVTVTNWIAGLAAALVALPLRKAIWVSLLGFLIIAALTPIQSAIYPKAGRFLNFKQEIIFTVADGRKAKPMVVERLVGMTAHSLVAPQTSILEQPEPLAPFKLSKTTRSVISGPLQGAALAGWVLLLGLGLASARKGLVAAQVVAIVGLVLAGFAALHLVYGEDVFLYALHFAPMYLMVAAWGLVGPWRNVSRLVLIATLPLSFFVNLQAFRADVALVNVGRLIVDSGITGFTQAPVPRLEAPKAQPQQ